MRSKGRLILLILMIAAGVLLYIMADSGVAGLYLAMLVLFIIGGIAMSRIPGRKLTAQVSSGVRSARGDRFLYRIEVKNEGRFAVPDCQLDLLLVNRLTEKIEKRELRFSLPARGSRELSLEMDGEHCGCIELTGRKLKVMDPMGFFARRQKVYLECRHYVLPQAGGYPLTEDQVSQYDMESYRYSQEKSGGDPSETFNLREYAPGDSVKSIHWNLTAKSGDLMIREPGLPVENNILILLDKCVEADADKIDELLDLAASVSRELLGREIAHTLGWYEDGSNGLIFRDINDENSMWEALMEAENSPWKPEEASTIWHLLGETADMKWSGYIYVASEDRDLERLREYGQVTLVGPTNIA